MPASSRDHRRQSGLTLIEVLFSVVILTSAVLSAVVLIPLVMRTLEQSRFAMLASVKTTEIVNSFAQSTRNWMNFGLRATNRIAVKRDVRNVKCTIGFRAGDMPDLEHHLLREHDLALPVPPDIARRLDSPDGLIARVIAAGGVLFYPQPAMGLDASRRAYNGQMSFDRARSGPPELQKLVFAVVTPAQQNLLTNHPMVPWPIYEMYPFPHQGYVWRPTRTGDGFYQGQNWRALASQHPGSPWASSLDELEDMLRWGYSPLYFKMTDSRSEALSTNRRCGCSILDATGGGDPAYFTAVPAPIEAIRTGMNALYPTPYVFANELGTSTAGRLPSLGMRRFYRTLAKRLWDSLDPGGTLGDPLTTDLSGRPLSDLHPARILALSYLTEAAMLVTGSQLPFIDNNDDTDTTNDVDISASFPGSSDEPVGTAPLPAEIAWAQQVHENLMQWTMRFTSHFPYDMNVPRPANRQMMMDRPLLCWDLFPTGGAAVRTPLNLNTATESTYPMLSPPAYTGTSGPGTGGRYAGFATFFGGSGDREVGQLNTQWADWGANWPSSFQGMHGTNASHWWYGQPFAPSHRTRLLVYWAVDWKNYEDAESAPSLPMDAGYSLYDLGGTVFNAAENLMDWDHPEARLMWTDARRTTDLFRNTSSEAGAYASLDTMRGAHGADRNGNGVFDRGSIPASTRMRASEVARFVVYDPVTYGSLRR